MKHKLESKLQGEISIISDMQIQNMKIMASDPITSWQIDGETMETSDRLYFLGLQDHCR